MTTVLTPTFPFPTGLLRKKPQEIIHVIAHSVMGMPTAVCMRATDAADCATALALFKESSLDSFVLYHDWRCAPDGTVFRYDPTRPNWAGELHLSFDVEWVKVGPQPRVYVFTSTPEEWEAARQAMRYLLQLQRLSPKSYLEGVNPYNGVNQGVQASALDAPPHGPGLVAQFRDAAIRARNSAFM